MPNALDTASRDLAREHRPYPSDAENQARWQEADRRVGMMVGRWRSCASDRIREYFTPEVAQNMRADRPDLSINPLRFYADELARLYDEPPSVSAEDAPADLDLTPIVPPTLWAQLADVNRLVWAVNEMAIRVDFEPQLNGVSYRPVTPNFICAWAPSHSPTVPNRVEETRWRDNATGGEWTIEEWDLRDPTVPTFTIWRVDETRGKGATTVRVDATADYVDTTKLVRGYPYWSRSGQPVLPYVLYHRHVQHSLWAWHRGIELIEGTLNAAALRTFWGHGFRNASYPSTHAIGVEPMSMKIRGTGGSQPAVGQIVNDPTAITVWRRTDPGGGLVQLSATMSPLEGMQAIRMYVADLATFAGLSPGDVEATSGGAESGIALSIRREGRQRAQRQLREPSAAGDRQLLSTAATLVNAYQEGLTQLLPEEPGQYGVTYVPVPKTPGQLQAELARVDAMASRGLASDLDALRVFHPELTREQALDRVRQVEHDKADVEAVRAEGEPTPPPDNSEQLSPNLADDDTPINGAGAPTPTGA